MRWVSAGAVTVALIAVLAGADRAGHLLVPWMPLALSAAPGEAAPLAPLRSPLVAAHALDAARESRVAAAQAGFAAASRLGWRDPSVQAWAAGAALATGQPKIAALRAEALLRAAPGNPANVTILAAIAADDAALRRLVARIGGDAPVVRAMAAGIADLPPRQHDAALALVTAASHDRRARAALLRSGLVEKMAARDRRVAMAMQQVLRGPGALDQTGLWAPDFTGADGGRRAAFRWQKAEASSAVLGVSADGTVLRVARLAGVPEPVAGITTLAAAGEYALNWRAGKGADGAPDLTLDAQCAEPAGTVTNGPLTLSGGAYRRIVTVPKRCVAVRLRIFAPATGAARRWLAAPRFMRLPV